jgi:hypothetical protein
VLSADTGSMLTLLALTAPVAAIVALDVLAARFGRDSRPGFDERMPLA